MRNDSWTSTLGRERPRCYLRPMSYVRCVRGLVSGIEYSADAPMNLDPTDGRPVEMVFDLERLAAAERSGRRFKSQFRDAWLAQLKLRPDSPLSQWPDCDVVMESALPPHAPL